MYRQWTCQANVVPKITGTIQRAPINSKQFEFLAKEYQHAVTLPNGLEMSNVELLIGNDYCSDLILPERKKVIPGLYLLGSRGAASGDIFARHLAAHQRIWN